MRKIKLVFAIQFLVVVFCCSAFATEDTNMKGHSLPYGFYVDAPSDWVIHPLNGQGKTKGIEVLFGATSEQNSQQSKFSVTIVKTEKSLPHFTQESLKAMSLDKREEIIKEFNFAALILGRATHGDTGFFFVEEINNLISVSMLSSDITRNGTFFTIEHTFFFTDYEIHFTLKGPREPNGGMLKKISDSFRLTETHS